MRYFWLPIIATILFVASACVPSKSFDRDAATHIHSIAITGPDEPAVYDAVNNDASSATSHHSELDVALRAIDFNLGAEIQSALASELTEKGYKTSRVKITHKEKELLTSEQVKHQDADAVLDSTILGVGYAGGLLSGEMAPLLLIDVELLDTKSGTILFGRRYYYTRETFPSRLVVLPVDQKYVFANYNDLVANPQLAAEGLRAAVPMIAHDVGNALRK